LKHCVASKKLSRLNSWLLGYHLNTPRRMDAQLTGLQLSITGAIETTPSAVFSLAFNEILWFNCFVMDHIR
jgi:hypothetical protein